MGRRKRPARGVLRTLSLSLVLVAAATGASACGGDDPMPAAGQVITAETDDGGTVVSFTWTPVKPEDLPLAEREDLERIAATEGIPFEQAVADIGNQPAIGHLIDIVRSRFPDDYATGELTGENGGKIWFTGPPPPEALELIEASAKGVEVASGPKVLFSEHQLVGATDRVNEVAHELLPDGVAGAGAEPAEGVVVQVFDLGSMTADELKARIEGDPRVKSLGIPVVIDVDPRYGQFGGGGGDGELTRGTDG
jgi:hypothetical protein